MDPEGRFLAWAARHRTAPTLHTWLARIHRLKALAAIALLGLMVAAGWLAAHAAVGLDRSRPTNIYWLLGGVLLPQTILLAVWLVLTATGGVGVLGAGLGGLLRSGLQRLLVGRMGGNPAGLAAAAAVARVESTTSITRWSIAVLSNGLWCAFNVGSLAGALALLAVQQHTFCWESTIFSAEGYRRITAVIAAVPSALGFPVPDAAQIAAARLDPSDPAGFPAQDEAARMAWSGLLVGSVVAYGLLPRATLTILGLLALSRARRRFRLDLDGPLFSPLVADPASSRLQEGRGVDPAWPSIGSSPNDFRIHAAQAIEGRSGAPAIVGVELATPASGWPPSPLTGMEVVDLGRIEGREDRRAALSALAAMSPPRSLTIIASLLSTPDRGLAALLRDLVAVTPTSASLVLTGGSAMRSRSDAEGIEQRTSDWRRIAEAAGIPAMRIREIDLDSLTAASSATLRGLLTDDRSPPEATRRMERAAALIADAADGWLGEGRSPSIASQAALHRSLADLYGALADRSGWRGLLGLEGSEPSRLLARAADAIVQDASAQGGGRHAEFKVRVAGILEQSSRRMTSLLPPSLRASPRWMAAGALAGALGCVTVGLAGPMAVAAPLALQALPIWSAIGAAIGGGISLGRSGREKGPATRSEDSKDVQQWATALRAAMLQALVLEHQGQGEARLARLLEAALPDRDPDESLLASPTAGSARRWLDAVRHRLDLALMAEQGGRRREVAS